ncbi:MAG: hypothetical protein ACOCUT_00965 [bacterium]
MTKQKPILFEREDGEIFFLNDNERYEMVSSEMAKPGEFEYDVLQSYSDFNPVHSLDFTPYLLECLHEAKVGTASKVLMLSRIFPLYAPVKKREAYFPKVVTSPLGMDSPRRIPDGFLSYHTTATPLEYIADRESEKQYVQSSGSMIDHLKRQFLHPSQICISFDKIDNEMYKTFSIPLFDWNDGMTFEEAENHYKQYFESMLGFGIELCLRKDPDGEKRVPLVILEHAKLLSQNRPYHAENLEYVRPKTLEDLATGDRPPQPYGQEIMK